jgi:hypothetical protein
MAALKGIEPSSTDRQSVILAVERQGRVKKMSRYYLFGLPSWTRTSNLQFRKLLPYPLGHGEIFHNTRDQLSSFSFDWQEGQTKIVLSTMSI